MSTYYRIRLEIADRAVSTGPLVFMEFVSVICLLGLGRVQEHVSSLCMHLVLNRSSASVMVLVVCA